MKKKSVLIKKHKGYEIRYKEEKFYIAKKGRRANPVNYGGESEALKWIVKKVLELEQEKKEEGKLKKLKDENKALERTKMVVDAKSFYKMVTGLDHLVTECLITFRDKKVCVTAMDPANVALVHRQIFFKGRPGPIVGINISQIKSLLTRELAKNDLTISFRLTSSGTKKMVIGGGFGEFDVPCTDIEKEEKVPNLKFGAKAKVNKENYYEVVDLAGKVAESIKFKVFNKELFVEAEGDTLGYNKLVGKATGKNSKAKFSIEYLKKRFFNLPGSLTLELGKDYPLRVSDEFGNWLVLAPRVG